MANRNTPTSLILLRESRAFKTIRRFRTRIAVAITLLLAFLIFFAACWVNLDPDFGWHLEAGHYIVTHGIPARDIFTYTAKSFPWIDHEWGADCIVWLFYHLGGYALLSFVFAVIWTTALVLGGVKPRLLTALIGAAALLPYVLVRPSAWTVLLFSLLLALLERRPKCIWWVLPVMFVVWANLHGGFVIGLCAVGFFALKERRQPWLTLFLLSLLGTFINPYGPRLYVEIFRTISDSSLHAQIAEWRRFYFFVQSLAFVVLWVTGFIWFHRLKLRQWFNLSAGLFVAALFSTKNVPLFIVSGIRDLNKFYRQFNKDIGRFAPEFSRLISVTLLVCTSLWMVAIYYGAFANISWQREAVYPVKAVAYLQRHPCQGELFNDYNYGGYIIWKLPGRKVFIDGRMPSWRDSNGNKYIDVYHQVIASSVIRQKVFARYDIRCALLSRSGEELHMAQSLLGLHWQYAVTEQNDVLLLAPLRPPVAS